MKYWKILITLRIKGITFCCMLAGILFPAFAQLTGKITVYTIGDSTMANKDTTNCNPERGWAQVLQPFFDADHVVVENHAVNGRSSKSFFEEGRWKPIVDGLQPGDYVFIQFGHNDEKSEDIKRYTDPKGSYHDFLTIYVNETRAKGAYPVLMTPIARRKFSKNPAMPVDTHGEYAAAVRELALKLNVPIIDMAEQTRKLLLKIGSEDSKRMFLWLQPGRSPKYPEGLQDNTHLNKFGAFRIAQLAVGGMRELNLPLTKYLKWSIYDLQWIEVALNQPNDWYGTEEAVAIAENVLLYQRNTGGWPKNIPMHHELDESDKQTIFAAKDKTDDSTMDNDATYLESFFLAKVYNKTHTEKYKDAFMKALHYILAAQYPNGGWPQYYPLQKGYYTHITYNDNLMVNVMMILKGIAEHDDFFAFVDDPALVRQCTDAFDRGVDCILKTQYRQNGKLTGWCAQHDEHTLGPAQARSYELPSLSGNEAAGIVLLLMEIKNPKPEVKEAIDAAVEWFEKVKITGIKVETYRDGDGRRDNRIVSDPSASAIWARFYELDDNRPFFCDRDGIKKYALTEIEHERRNGYGWYTYNPQKVLDKYKEYVIGQAFTAWGDQGNGTYVNPILNADYSDPDVIRFQNKYYMVSSDFHYIGMQVLESDDMVNWRIISQIYDRFDFPGWDENKHYAGGSWAPAIRYHDGKFWVYFCTPDEGLFMSNATDPSGPWLKPVHVKAIDKWEDPCPFWDEDGQAYLGRSQRGAGPIILHKMNPAGTQLLDEGKTIYTGPVAEGTKFLKKDGYYYLIIPEGGVSTGWQTILRSKNIYGPYEKKVVLEQGTTDINGPHQGALVDTPDGEWWFFHFQQTEPLGRVVHLQPVYWKDGWPYIGVDIDMNGIGEPVRVWKKPNVGKTFPITFPQTDDDFSSSTLGLQWQFNHNPANEAWSLTEKKGYLMFQALKADNLRNARNTLTQKSMGYIGNAVVRMDIQEFAEGQRAGLCCMGNLFNGIGIVQENGKNFLYLEKNGEIEKLYVIKEKDIYLKVTLNAITNEHQFYYSPDNKNFTPCGDAYALKFGFWKGSRIGLFSYNTIKESGKVYFDWFRYK